MIYILTTLLMLIGIMFHVMQKVRLLRNKFPDFAPMRIWKTFMSEEWDSMGVSFLVWLVFELWIYISIRNGFIYPKWYDMYGIYALALVLGYSGQRIAYRYLATAEKVLQKRADDIIENNDNEKEKAN